jgi:hypothetical protein
VHFREKTELAQLNPINHEQAQRPDEEIRDLLLGRIGTRDIDAESLGLQASAVTERNGGIELGSELVV